MTAINARKYSVALAFAAFATFSVLGYAQTMGWPEKDTSQCRESEYGRARFDRHHGRTWSTPAQRDKLMSVMLNQGPEKLLDVLRDMPHVGYFNTPEICDGSSVTRGKRRSLTVANAWCSPPTGPSASVKRPVNRARSTIRYSDRTPHSTRTARAKA